jgi:glycosyltransferase involved in cell wall biosynthesis
VVAAGLTGARVVYDMRDPFADSYPFAKWVRPIAYLVDWLVMARCDGFVVPNEERVAYLGRWSRRRPVSVVRNLCRDEAITDTPAALDCGSGAPGVRVAWLGYLVPSRGFELLRELLGSEGGRLELWVAGLCRSEALRRELETTPGIRWLGLLPRPQALTVMRRADAVALLYDPAIPVNRQAAPNKLYEALMTGTPVIVSRGMSVAGEVESEGLGWVVEYGDAAALGEVIAELREPGARGRLRARCREYFLRRCRWEDELPRYRELYERVLPEELRRSSIVMNQPQRRNPSKQASQ